ncbi:hypothetical protein SODALDRAFT_329777 [Sodiomyces alkalinus F11]|uniref:Uncharacterized protein n=1 Tax=Sodiomyces alkalinus (strain CBS 110278 / VKM F-3762 / F11) TaxID=1314773 RepID=A0A3N2PJP0_SODAK|nr:hypothetical protein SODALDRAFT_329777 [Sodiomyces alkalinus F11]ROT34526.1 hypothetical protein SODALDRAFT_329777 [Sodiomyces alkalinus F11]
MREAHHFVRPTDQPNKRPQGEALSGLYLYRLRVGQLSGQRLAIIFGLCLYVSGGLPFFSVHVPGKPT